MTKRKRGPGRPALGKRGRVEIVPVRFTTAELRAIETAVRKENVEIDTDPNADVDDRRPATVSSWIRDHALDPLGLATNKEPE